MAQTSVEWLFDTLAQTPMTEWYQVREEAIKKHKAEILDAYDKVSMLTAEQYYNETFKNQ